MSPQERLKQYRKMKQRRLRWVRRRIEIMDNITQVLIDYDYNDIISFIAKHGHYDAQQTWEDYIPTEFDEHMSEYFFSDNLKKLKPSLQEKLMDEYYKLERSRRYAPMFTETDLSRIRKPAFPGATHCCAHCGKQYISYDSAFECANSHHTKTYEFAPELKESAQQ